MNDLQHKMKKLKYCIAAERIFDPDVIRLPGNKELDQIMHDLKVSCST